VLIDSAGRARLTDFGLSSVSDNAILKWISHPPVSSKGGIIRWQAPELFDMKGDEQLSNTTSSDVYALGCVNYEARTSFHPCVRS
jgi:serine/threonine protein kinase